jgi:hypothetical protein
MRAICSHDVKLIFLLKYSSNLFVISSGSVINVRYVRRKSSTKLGSSIN